SPKSIRKWTTKPPSCSSILGLRPKSSRARAIQTRVPRRSESCGGTGRQLTRGVNLRKARNPEKTAESRATLAGNRLAHLAGRMVAVEGSARFSRYAGSPGAVNIMREFEQLSVRVPVDDS